MIVARWQSRGGAHWVELHAFDNGGFFYRGNGCGGNMTATLDQSAAVAQIQQRVDAGEFLPDAARVPMRRTV
jgi:hypothetical protein